MQELRSQRRRKAEAWNKANRLVGGLILAGLVTVLASAFVPEIARLRQLDRELDQERTTLAAENERRSKQAREVQLLETDPEYVEIVARDKIGVMKEGETIIRLDASEAKPATAAKP